MNAMLMGGKRMFQTWLLAIIKAHLLMEANKKVEMWNGWTPTYWLRADDLLYLYLGLNV